MSAALHGAAPRSHGARLQREQDQRWMLSILKCRGLFALHGDRLPAGEDTARAVPDALADAIRERDQLRAEVARLKEPE